jgi:glycosyltransferase involved in cell wall biosynthesis
MKPIVSIVIATRNRCENLRRCLESLQSCEVPPGSFAEVLVVDNGGDDATRALVSGFEKSEGAVRFRYLQEPRRGKGFAVNSGVRHATGPILAFTDDDALVDKRWFLEIIGEFARDDELGLLAGRVEVPSDHTDSAWTVGRERKLLNGLTSLEGQVLGFNHDAGERDRTREYLRGWGAFYLKFILAGDRGVARQAWWRLRRILRDLTSGKHTYGALYETWQLCIGASIMAKRMLFSKMA